MSQPQTLRDLYRDIEPELGGVESEIEASLSAEHPAVREMARHASGRGGKRMRPALVILVARSAGEQREIHARLGAVVEMIHLATLVHDDVIDAADMRRQVRTVNDRWSNHDAVLLGDVIFARAINLLARMGDERSLLRLTAAVSTLCEGEIIQNHRRRDADLTEEAYYGIIDGKTAVLYAAACELSAWLAGASDAAANAFGSFGRELGLAFQIADDCLDLVGDESVVGKSLGTDLRGGKMTLPMMLLRDRLDADDRARLTRMVRSGETAEGDLLVLLRSLHDTASLEDALARARDHVARGLETVRGTVDGQAFAPLEAIAAFVVARTL